jgi:hypothetical protein
LSIAAHPVVLPHLYTLGYQSCSHSAAAVCVCDCDSLAAVAPTPASFWLSPCPVLPLLDGCCRVWFFSGCGTCCAWPARSHWHAATVMCHCCVQHTKEFSWFGGRRGARRESAALHMTQGCAGPVKAQDCCAPAQGPLSIHVPSSQYLTSVLLS